MVQIDHSRRQLTRANYPTGTRYAGQWNVPGSTQRTLPEFTQSLQGWRALLDDLLLDLEETPDEHRHDLAVLLATAQDAYLTGRSAVAGAERQGVVEPDAELAEQLETELRTLWVTCDQAESIIRQLRRRG